MSKLRQLIREEIKKTLKEEERAIPLGLSGLKAFARKNGYSVRTKSSGGRVPYVYLKKNGKEYGPFDPNTTTSRYLDSKLAK